jgi:hypothetical protein
LLEHFDLLPKQISLSRYLHKNNNNFSSILPD